MQKQSRGTPVALLIAGLALTGCGELPSGIDESPLLLSVVSGEQQSWIAGYELPDALVVRVTTQRRGDEVPVPRQLVNFRVIEGDGTAFAGASMTNVDGIAQEYWTLGPEPGDNVLEVRAVDPTTGEKQVHATFTATAVPWPDELNTVQNHVSDDWVIALVQRLEPGASQRLLEEFEVVLNGLGDDLDLDAVEHALAKAQTLVVGGAPTAPGSPAHVVELAFLDLIVRRSQTLFDQALEAVLGA